MSRKTFYVADLKDRINHSLQQPTLKIEAKQALATTLEHILMDTGNYKGFCYTDATFLADLESLYADELTHEQFDPVHDGRNLIRRYH